VDGRTLGAAMGENGAPRCIVCGSAEARTVFHEFGVDIVRCRGCRHVYSTHDADIDFNGYFEQQDLSDGSRETAYWDQAHAAIYADFSRRYLAGAGGRLLDVGAGLGFFVKHVADHHPDWEAHGSEISAKAVAYGTDVLELPHLTAGRVQEAGYPPAHFDLITLWDVIEHLADPDAMLQCLAGLLKPGGRLFLHTPNIRVQLPKARLKRRIYGMTKDRSYLEARDHLNDYSPRTLRRVMARNGLGDLRFIHLKPIQSVAGSNNRVLRFVKNAWVFGAAALHHATFGAVNLDNLFVIATKPDSAVQ
jgi:2-polyprenyl-3-methyl-5-hydroxy-6-metoxy-1,4-benzoquinol methylase